MPSAAPRRNVNGETSIHPVADRHEVRDARLPLLDQQGHRVGPIGGRRPFPERAEGISPRIERPSSRCAAAVSPSIDRRRARGAEGSARLFGRAAPPAFLGPVVVRLFKGVMMHHDRRASTAWDVHQQELTVFPPCVVGDLRPADRNGVRERSLRSWQVHVGLDVESPPARTDPLDVDDPARLPGRRRGGMRDAAPRSATRPWLACTARSWRCWRPPGPSCLSCRRRGCRGSA